MPPARAYDPRARRARRGAAVPINGPIKVILNPTAGTAIALEQLQEALEELGEVAIARTERAGHAEELARAAADEGFGTVVAAGGDGTLHEIVNGLSEAGGRCRLGLVPLGTGNDFARTLGIPLEPREAVAVLARGDTRETDVVDLTIGGRLRRMINSSAGGLVGELGERMDKRNKEWWGSLAYFISAAIELPRMQEYRLRLAFDDSPRWELDGLDMFVGNGRSVGGGVRATPEAMLNDGKIDVLIAPTAPMATIALWGAKVLTGQHRPDDGLITRRAARLEVDSDPPMPINADGELLGTTPAVYEVRPRALRVIVGQSDAF